MLQTDKQGNKIVLQDNGLILLTPKNGSTLVYNIRELIKFTGKASAKRVVTPENPLEAFYHNKSCPHCRKEFSCKIPGYTYAQAVGETKFCPYCGGALLW